MTISDVSRAARRLALRLGLCLCSGLAATAAPVLAQPGPEVGAIQRRLLEDPEAAERVRQLGEDPLVQSILDDAATMKAVREGDLGALMADPKIRALMAHPGVRELSRELR